MKKKKLNKNYLEKIPSIKETIDWSADDNAIVTLHIENKGLFNWIGQRLFKKPRISHVHLDEFGSFVWLNIDGKIDIIRLGEIVKEHFGEKAEPLYPRLATFVSTLENCDFVITKSAEITKN